MEGGTKISDSDIFDRYSKALDFYRRQSYLRGSDATVFGTKSLGRRTPMKYGWMTLAGLSFIAMAAAGLYWKKSDSQNSDRSTDIHER